MANSALGAGDWAGWCVDQQSVCVEMAGMTLTATVSPWLGPSKLARRRFDHTFHGSSHDVSVIAV
jgi:hypothetical protein